MGFINRFVTGVVAVSLLASCHNSQGTTTSASSQEKRKGIADQKMERVHLQSYGPDGIEWELTSPIGEGFSDLGQTTVKNLTVHLYNNSQKSTTVTADQGIMFNGAPDSGGAPLSLSNFGLSLQPGDMFLNGNVVLVSTEGHRLRTDWAHYKKLPDIIVSTAPVEVIRDGSITKGMGMEATTDLSSIKIFNETLVIPAKSPTTNE